MHAQPYAERTFENSRAVARALIGALLLCAAGPAQAFNYASGDLVGIFVDGNSELIVNLGPAASLSAGASFNFVTPSGFGPDGSTGGKFLAYATEAPFSGSLGRNLTFTTDTSVDPPSYDANVTAYVARIGLAQSALDDGGSIDKYLEFLNNFPLPPTGGVITNTATQLALLTSNPASYSSTIGSAGDRIDNQLPFETDATIGGSASLVLWRTERITNTTAETLPLGVFLVEGNVGGGTPTTRVTYLPEPASPVLLGSGVALLAGLSSARRRRLAR